MKLAPTVVVGDLHGDHAKLAALLDHPAARKRRLVFVGDYINRGPSSRRVLETMAALCADRYDTVFLRGNHEDALLEFLRTGNPSRFLRHGGLSTIRHYLPDPPPADAFAEFLDRFPAEHQEFVGKLPACFETAELLVSHAGYDPSSPEDRSPAVTVNGRFPELFEPGIPQPRPLVVFGHYVQQNGRPYDRNGVVCLDTGCGTLSGGRLTMLLLPEHEFVQF